MFPFAIRRSLSNLPPVRLSRGDSESHSVTPTAAQMVPRTRHFVSLDRIFEHFGGYFECANDLRKKPDWGLFGIEKYGVEKKYFVRGALDVGAYSLNDASKMAAYMLHPSRALGTRAAVLLHTNPQE